jgi:zinc protease
LIEKYVFAVTKTTSMKAAAKKLKKVKSVTEETELSMSQIPFPLKNTKVWIAPSTEVQKLEGQGMVLQKSYFDGTAGYSISMQTGRTELTETEVAAKKKSVGLFPELNYAKTGMTYELVGIENVDGTDMYVLKCNDGETQTFDYFDTKTFMKVKSISIQKNGEETVETTATYGDFKEVNGLLFPHTMTLSVGEVSFSGKTTSITVNGKTDMSTFK